MVCNSVMEKPACNQLDPHDEPPTNKHGTAWWKLARPTISRRRRSFLDLSGSPLPSSGDRLFRCDRSGSSAGDDATSSSELWTSSKADTEAPSPSDDESPRPRSQQQSRSQRFTSYSTSKSSSGDDCNIGTGECDRYPFHFLSVGNERLHMHAGSDSHRSPKVEREAEVTSDALCADRSHLMGAGAASRQSALKAADDRRHKHGVEENLWDETIRTASKAARTSQSSNHLAQSSPSVNGRQGMKQGNSNGRSTVVASPRTATRIVRKADMLQDEGDSLRCDESGLSPARAVINAGTRGGPHAMYDILAVDRGCGFCDTSVVPFSVKDDEKELTTERIRAVSAGQGEFLARRGFAAGLVSHFLEETNAEFTELQGGTSRGMTDEQLSSAAKRLEGVFVPAVKKLKQQGSSEIVLDSLFDGTDSAGDFVVRFEVTIARCHPDDMEGNPMSALRACAPAIREATRDEGIPDNVVHEVVFVGRPTWELVSPVLDFSKRS